MTFTLDNKIEEKLKHIKKAIEIVGGKEFLLSFKEDTELYNLIFNKFLSTGAFSVAINGREYTLEQLLAEKTAFEKNYIKNKSKIVNEVLFKVKKYDSNIETLIRRYKKSNSIEDFKKIDAVIRTNYSKILDKQILSSVQDIDIFNINFDSNNYYGEYLTVKREDLILLVLKALGV